MEARGWRERLIHADLARPGFSAKKFAAKITKTHKVGL
jgi:hypothetical protein